MSIRLNSFEHVMTIVGSLCLLFEIILCEMLIFFLTSMFLVIYNLNSGDRTVAWQLNFNHRIVKVQTQNNSAIKWVVLVTFVFLLCNRIFLRCSLLFLTGHKCGNDFFYKITLQVINSGINPKVYAFFKRYKARMRKASLQKASLFNNRVVPTQEKHQLMHILKTFLEPEDFLFRIYSWPINSYLNCCSVTKLPMKQR